MYIIENTQNLIVTLKQMLEIYKQIINLSVKKKQIIIENKVEEIKNLTLEETKATKLLLIIDEDLKHNLEAISLFIYNENVKIDLQTLLNILSDKINSKTENYEKLINILEELKKVSSDIELSIKILKELNEENKILLKNAIDYIDFTINVIRTSNANVASYDSSGNITYDGSSEFNFYG